jgi:CRP/FNR family transcriptional regulator
MEQIAFRQLFPTLETTLQEELQHKGEARYFKAGEQMMRTGQFFRSTLLILDGLVKVYRNWAS